MPLVLQQMPVFVLVFFRVAGLGLSAPLFGSAKIPKRVKLLLSLVLAMGLSGHVAAPDHMPQSPWELAIGIGGELAFGLAMGMGLSLTFIAVNWAGEIIGQQMGINLGEVFDPAFGGQASLVGDLYFMFTLVIFLSVGGHREMLKGVHASFEALPVLSVGLTPNVFELVLDLMRASTLLAMQVAAPMLLTMLVVDLALGFIGKTMPQFNVMTAGTSIKTAVGIAVLLAGLTLTSETVRESVIDSMHRVQDAWSGNVG